MEKYPKSMEARFPQTEFSRVIWNFQYRVSTNHHHLRFACMKKMKSVEIIMREWEEFKFELIDIKNKYQLLKENLTDNYLKIKETTSERAL